MRRSALAYLADIVDCCDAIAVALEGVDLAAYEANRTVRSAVEREFTIIGEAVNYLSKLDPERAARITHAGMIVGFRNLLVHDYPAILDSAVWAIARNDAPVLSAECAGLIRELQSGQ
jgi:uncharacterized protein with HEPN domain